MTNKRAERRRGGASGWVPRPSWGTGSSPIFTAWWGPRTGAGCRCRVRASSNPRATASAATLAVDSEFSRRYVLRLHLADTGGSTVCASLGGLDLAATFTAGVLEVATPIMRGGAIVVAW